MDIDTQITGAVTELTSQVTGAFGAIAPFVLLTGIGFASWKYVKRFLSKA